MIWTVNSMNEQAVDFVWSLAMYAPPMKPRRQGRYTTELQILMALAEASDVMGCSQLSAARIAKTIGRGKDTVKEHLQRMEYEGRIKVRRPFKLNENGEPVGKKTVSFVYGETVYRVGGPRGNVIQIVGIHK
jgi:hypothetical protein